MMVAAVVRSATWFRLFRLQVICAMCWLLCPDMPQLYNDIFSVSVQERRQISLNHALGNLIIAAIAEMRNSTYEAIQILSKSCTLMAMSIPLLTNL